LGIQIIENNIKNNITFTENYPYELILQKNWFLNILNI
jgi:hypothetical protein